MINVIDVGMRVVALLIFCALFLGVWWSPPRSPAGLALEFFYIASLAAYVTLPRRHVRAGKFAFYWILLLLGLGVIAIIVNHIVRTSLYLLLDNIPAGILLIAQTILILIAFALRKSQEP